IATNLKVAEGLLAFYQTQVETCLDGRQAVELVRNRNYDIVFMDHMMPGMDGIEAAAAIRALEGERFRNLPIIALTANAIAGMKEMFLANGFNDYLAKPIELSKLDDIMGIWIPRKKQVHTEAASPYGQSAPEAGDSDAANAGDIVIKGIDVQQGIAMTGGSQKAYFEILGLYCKDVDKRLDMLGDFLVRVSGKVGETAEEEADFSGFTTQVHALKSASATIGAAKIAKTAARLEEAGKNGDRKTIAELLGGFNAELAALVRGIRSVQGADSGASPPRSEADPGAAPANTPAAGTAGKPAANPETLAALTRLREALAAEDIRRVDAILNTLHNNGQNPELTVSLNDVSDNVLMSEFQKAITIVDELLKTG
ncbi:MAG: response regulator, partial [Spirochaetaceae bacterium]|nr:response regulator [Spirochaetaceae bacterium]